MNYLLLILLNCFSWEMEMQIQNPKHCFEVMSFKTFNFHRNYHMNHNYFKLILYKIQNI